MAGYWEIKFRSRVRGPISSGRMAEDAEDYAHDVAEALAEEGKDIWVRNLRGSIRFPTPYYWTRIDTRELSPTRYQVHDHDVIYGPWLESGEYTPRRMFTGYFSERRAEEELKARRSSIARRILREYRSSGRLI